MPLMDAAFGSAPGPEYFDWKYARNPHGEMVGFEALAGSTPVAFYCVIPQVYSVDGVQVGVFQSVDTMTDPAYQGRGLFVQLATLTYNEVSRIDPGYTLVGIAGESSLPGFVRRLGWRHIHDIRLFSRNVGSYPFGSSRAAVGKLRRRRLRTWPSLGSTSITDGKPPRR